MSRPARVDASVYRDRNGWRGAIELGIGPDGKRLRKKVRGMSKQQVLDKLKTLRREFDAGLARADDRLTVGEFLDRWVRDNLDGLVSEKTRDSYADTVRLHLKPAFGSVVVRHLTVAQVDGLWRLKREQGYKPNSIRIMRTVLRLALTQAEREGLLTRNVAALSGSPRIRATEGRSLTVDGARELLAALKGHRLEPVITFALTFGLRRGEALGLLWADLDLDAGTLRVTHGVKRVKSPPAAATKTHLVVGELKTRRSRRTLYLTPQLVELLRRHRARQAEERIAAGPAYQDHGLIFPTEVGTPLDPDNFSHTFSRLTERAGLGRWHPHELRHSGASLMLAQGTDLYVVSEILGHSSIAITKDVYGHLVEGHQRAAAEAMSNALLGPSGSPIGSPEAES